MSGSDTRADFVVVGGGTAGCVVARRLVEAGARVVVLEAGGEYSRLRLGPPLPGLRQMTRFSWRYFTRPQAGLGHRRLSLPLGRVLGGSSSVNAMMYCRGSAADYDSWAELGNPGWAFADVLPWFVRAEGREAGPTPLRGGDGPLAVSAPRHVAPFSRAFLEACEEAGIPANPDFNGTGVEGCGLFEVTQQRGERVTTARAYLAAARRLPGLTVLTGCHVVRIVLEGSRATGVEFRRDGSLHVARAERELVVSAGAVNSPKLLLLSGIGPRDHLCAVGIAPRLELPGVGQGLQDHPRLPVLYETPRISPGDLRHWVPGAVAWLLARRGVMASNCCEAGAFVRSASDAVRPDLQFVTHFQSSLYPGAVDLQVCLLDARSRGTVRLRSADPAEPPDIDPGFLSDPGDVQRLVRGVALARRLASARALREFPLGAELLPGADLRSEDEVAGHVRAMAETCYHLAGTCRMGSDPMAVVDTQLRVHGVEGLRVADASVMPELVRGNPLAPTVMIAERASDLLLAR